MNTETKLYLDRTFNDAGRTSFALERMVEQFPAAEIKFEHFDDTSEWASLYLAGNKVRSMVGRKGDRISSAAKLARDFMGRQL